MSIATILLFKAYSHYINLSELLQKINYIFKPYFFVYCYEFNIHIGRGMLVLTRKIGQKLFIGDDTKIELLKVDEEQATFSIVTTKETKIKRGKLSDFSHKNDM